METTSSHKGSRTKETGKLVQLQVFNVHCGIPPVMFNPSLSVSLSNRVERLEEQLNDLVELHQHEMANLKQELASIEEKVAYQANERARDLQVTSY